MSESRYYNINEIFDFLGITREFESKCPVFPFNYGVDKVKFGWGNIVIPKEGIRTTIINKLKDIHLCINEINMMYCIPFIVTNYGRKEGELKTGCLYKNISITFDYAHQWKYGDIEKSIYETCFYIYECGTATNDFYLIQNACVQEFLSYYVINNQYGLGSLRIGSEPIFSITLPDKNADVETDTKEEATESSNNETNEFISSFDTCSQSLDCRYHPITQSHELLDGECVRSKALKSVPPINNREFNDKIDKLSNKIIDNLGFDKSIENSSGSSIEK